MGCDIHLVAQKRVSGQWEAINRVIPNEYSEGENDKFTLERLFDDRNYRLFGMLANVRNGHGFAGVDTGDPFVFISEPRGYPEDFKTKDTVDSILSGEETDEYLGLWMGDHSHSWLGLQELIDYDWSQVAICRGVVDGHEFLKWSESKEWDEYAQPESWCGGISGRDVARVSVDEMERRIEAIRSRFAGKELSEALKSDLSKVYTTIQWPRLYSECAGTFYTRLLPMLTRIGKEVGTENVRIVFGFDS